ncbi:MAG TPA: hypothetical protein VK249_30015 [Anaerolineales bacterium]|nr:hypothetical protein [Anaerolineales bacterium]
MNEKKILNLALERAGWGLLAILWGATILFDFVPFGAGLIGTGLVLFGINLIQSINHLPMKNNNTIPGILILAWGGLELARPLLRQLFPSADLDWVIFAILLIGWGILLLIRVFLLSKHGPLGIFPNGAKE